MYKELLFEERVCWAHLAAVEGAGRRGREAVAHLQDGRAILKADGDGALRIAQFTALVSTKWGVETASPRWKA